MDYIHKFFINYYWHQFLSNERFFDILVLAGKGRVYNWIESTYWKFNNCTTDVNITIFDIMVIFKFLKNKYTILKINFYKRDLKLKFFFIFIFFGTSIFIFLTFFVSVVSIYFSLFILYIDHQIFINKS
jgi:hypothetical protein